MLSDKKLARIKRALGTERIVELQSLSSEALKDVIISAESSIKTAVEELDANPQYQELKENFNVIFASLREVKNRQNATIQYALSLLEDKGSE